MTNKTYDDCASVSKEDPLGQRFRVNFNQHRGIFEMPAKAGGPNQVGWLLQDLDRGWWGIFVLSRGMADYGPGDQFITELPMTVSWDFPRDAPSPKPTDRPAPERKMMAVARNSAAKVMRDNNFPLIADMIEMGHRDDEPSVQSALLAIQATKEECAKIADNHLGSTSVIQIDYDEACKDIATAIRAHLKGNPHD